MIRLPRLRARPAKSLRPASRTYRPLLEQLEDRSLLNGGRLDMVVNYNQFKDVAYVMDPLLDPIADVQTPLGLLMVQKEIEAPDHSLDWTKVDDPLPSPRAA